MTFFVASGTVILCLHVFSDYTGGDDISLHPAPLVYVASGTVSLFLHVFSDYTGGDDILLPLRKELVVLAAGHRNQRHASL